MSEPEEMPPLAWAENALNQALNPNNIQQGDGAYEVFGSTGGLVVQAYTNLTQYLRLIIVKLVEDDTEDTRRYLEWAIEILDRVHDVLAREATDPVRQELVQYEDFYYHMWNAVSNLSREPWTAYHEDIGLHLLRMGQQVERLATPPEEVWASHNETIEGVLRVDEKRFNKIYDAFEALDLLPDPSNDNDCLGLVRQSRDLLTQAVVSLRLPAGIVDISEEELYDDETRPTYIDFAYDSDETFLGLAGRIGLVGLSIKLGADVLSANAAIAAAVKQAEQKPNVVPELNDGDEQNPRPDLPDVQSSITGPTRKTEMAYIDGRAERRRNERFLANAQAAAMGPPDEATTQKRLEEYARENAVSERAMINLAEPGPPGIRDAVQDSPFDKLLYMTTITHWRYYQVLGL